MTLLTRHLESEKELGSWGLSRLKEKRLQFSKNFKYISIIPKMCVISIDLLHHFFLNTNLYEHQGFLKFLLAGISQRIGSLMFPSCLHLYLCMRWRFFEIFCKVWVKTKLMQSIFSIKQKVFRFKIIYLIQEMLQNFIGICN